MNPRPMYFSQVRIDPQNDSRIYVLGVQLHVSDDGGRDVHDRGRRQHSRRLHAMWINPNNPNHLMLGGDGGVGISYDRSKTYVWLANLPVGPVLPRRVRHADAVPVCGGLQDNNTWCGPSAVRNEWGIANDDWFIISGGDGFVGLSIRPIRGSCTPSRRDGNMNRIDRLTNERTNIRPEPGRASAAYRWNWDTPLRICRRTIRRRYSPPHIASSSPPTAATRGARSLPIYRCSSIATRCELMG